MSKELLRLPGLVDPHVHLREPGATQKEDFYTGTCAALAGGYTTVIDMPNNPEPTTTTEALREKIRSASAKTVCDVGFYFGATETNFPEYPMVENEVKGLKIYLDSTHGSLLVDTLQGLVNTFQYWSGQKPILVHAEDLSVAKVIGLVAIFRKPTHFCHISLESEIELIKKAKEQGLPITCEVTPHHLFLTEEDEKVLKGFGRMKPPLRSGSDVDALWKNLAVVDIIASDHAPHTIEEKQSDNPPFGVPGLETTLPLLLTAVAENRLTLEKLIELISTNPQRIFRLKSSESTFIEVDLAESCLLDNKNLKTKCGWTPFEGKRVSGRIRRVFLGGRKVFEDGVVLASPGSGKILL